MRISIVKKGEPVGFKRTPAEYDSWYLRGKKREILGYIKDEGLTTFGLARVTGSCAPADEYYTIACKIPEVQK